MRYFRVVALIFITSWVGQSLGSNVSDTSLRYWAKIGGNSSVHFFQKTPTPYKLENMFSSGYEISSGFKNSLLSFSIGYRNHLFCFKQFNSDLDIANHYGNYAEYNYLIESIPMKCELNSHLKSFSVGYNFGLSLNRASFKKIIVTSLPNTEITYSPNKSETLGTGINLSSGVSLQKQLNKKITAGFSIEALYDITRTYEYQNPSQMAGHQDYLKPYSYSPLSFLGSVYLVYLFK